MWFNLYFTPKILYHSKKDRQTRVINSDFSDDNLDFVIKCICLLIDFKSFSFNSSHATLSDFLMAKNIGVPS